MIMNGYGTIDAIYRPLGIGIIKNEKGETVIFTANTVQGGADGFQKLKEKQKVHYQVFKSENIGGNSIARDVWNGS
jgi:hypothetical protein